MASPGVNHVDLPYSDDKYHKQVAGSGGFGRRFGVLRRLGSGRVLVFVFLTLVALLWAMPPSTWHESPRARWMARMPVLPTAHTAELPAHVVKHLPWPSADPDLAGVAVTIKTGADVLLERTPIQLVSFLGRFPQIIVIGEDDAAVGPLPMYDVVSHTYEEMGPLGNLTQSIIDGWERLGRPKPGPHEFFVNGKLPDLWKPTPPSKPRLKRRDETLAIGSMSDDVPVPAAPETGDAVPGAGADPTVLVMGKAVPADAASPSTPPGRSHLVKRELQKHGKLVLDVDTTPPRDRSLGWQKDAHKNLPGFRLMATTFPDAEWYFMIDDDTYVFHSNLKRLLAKYNPNDRHYIGTITIFVGCDNVQEWGAGPDFAHGGAGILVSRGAMNRMMTGIDYCIGRYQTCWAGDIRTALCMRDHGIKLEPSNQFHKENPGSRNWQYPDNPCDEPITFHHLSVAQVQLLYLYESRFLAKHPGQPYTLGDVLADWETDRVVPNQDRPGNDIASLRTETPKLCRTACIDKSGCVAWSWVDHGCYLKKSISAPVERKDAASGVLPQKYQCRRSPSI